MKFKISLIISFLAHCIIILLLWNFKPANIGIKQKKETDRIKARLVKLITPVSHKQISSSGLKSKNKLNITPSKVQIEFTEPLPEISTPIIKKISKPRIDDNNTQISKKNLAQKEIKIQKHSTKKISSPKTSIKLKEITPDNLINTKEIETSLEKSIDKYFKNNSISVYPQKSGEKGSSLPGGITLNQLIGIEGKVVWSKNNKLPPYPEIAEKNGWEGTVKLKLFVNKNGSVEKIFIIEKSGFSILDRIAIKYARKWKILILKDKKPTKGIIILSIPFELKK